MKPIIPTGLIVALGILLFAASLSHRLWFAAMPDFLNGFMIGGGIGAIGLAVIRQWYIKQAQSQQS